ncbi:MAG: hypothetical protein EOP32_31445 [Rhodococcus sp. (in: high G+C Gram-positive bacteria)]|nr:MAG: hypothetical protein EOP32_31445 [Rhodococcus sp. (in: high G+C Gram-positive bacteria)]
MTTITRRAVIAAAAIALFTAPGVAAAAPNLHGDPNTPGTQVQFHNDPNDSNSYTCGAFGAGGAGVGSNPGGGTGQVNGTFGPGPVQGGCVGSDGSVYFPTGNAE